MQRSKKRACRAALGDAAVRAADQILQEGKITPKQFPSLRQALIDRGLWADTIMAVNALVVADLEARGTRWPTKGKAPPLTFSSTNLGTPQLFLPFAAGAVRVVWAAGNLDKPRPYPDWDAPE